MPMYCSPLPVRVEDCFFLGSLRGWPPAPLPLPPGVFHSFILGCQVLVATWFCNTIDIWEMAILLEYVIQTRFMNNFSC